jgi:hypothetical protein
MALDEIAAEIAVISRRTSSTRYIKPMITSSGSSSTWSSIPPHGFFGQPLNSPSRAGLLPCTLAPQLKAVRLRLEKSRTISRMRSMSLGVNERQENSSAEGSIGLLLVSTGTTRG